MLTCQEITELVTCYLEGRLPVRERLRFLMHMGLCRHCRRYIRQVRATVRSLGQVPLAPLPPEVQEALRQCFCHWKGRG